MKRALRYIFILLTAVLLMSHNAAAISISNDLQYIGGFNAGLGQANINSNCTYNAVNGLIANTNQDLECNINSFRLMIWERNYNNNEILAFNFNIKVPGRSVSQHNTVNIFKTTTNGFQVIGQEYEQLNTNTAQVTVYVKVWNTQTYSYIDFSSLTGYELIKLVNAPNSTGAEFDVGMESIYVISNSSAAIVGSIDSLGTKLDTIYTMENGWLGTIDSRLLVIIQQISSMNGKLDEISGKLDALEDLPQDTADAVTETEKEKVKEETDKAEEGADDAKTDSQQATSSLLSTVTGFFNAIINASATNCKFDSHLPFMTGNGTIDLCSIPAPAIVQGVGSLIALGLFAPFALHMFRRFVSITESFQR